MTYKWNVGNGLDFKAGKFATLHGQEVIESRKNFTFNRGQQDTVGAELYYLF